MPEPRVTFVIPCFNHGRYINAAVESCLRQRDADVRVVVIDDGSSDGSTQYAEEQFLSRIFLIVAIIFIIWILLT